MFDQQWDENVPRLVEGIKYKRAYGDWLVPTKNGDLKHKQLGL